MSKSLLTPRPGHSLSLPQCTLVTARRLPAARLVLVAGGRAPSAKWLQAVAHDMPLWAIDHGLDACRAAGLVPERLIGDGDSASSASWGWAQQAQVPTDRYPRAKDYTDTQLALRTAAACVGRASFPTSTTTAGTDNAHATADLTGAVSNGVFVSDGAVLLLTGCWGGRFDHAYSTMYSASRAELPVVLADERETCFFVQAGQQVTLHCQTPPKAISLLPLTARVTGVTLTGTHWPLTDATLTQASANAISNELEPPAEALTLRTKSGILGLYCCWQE